MIQLTLYPEEEDSFQIAADPEVMGRLRPIYRKNNARYVVRWHPHKQVAVVHLAFLYEHLALLERAQVRRWNAACEDSRLVIEDALWEAYDAWKRRLRLAGFMKAG